MVSRLSTRVEKLESAAKPRARIVHVEPGQTKAAAIRAHERKHWRIPPDARVILILHTFTSVL